MAGFKYYHYDPSFGAAAFFAALFIVATVRHTQLLFRNRAWYFIPFMLGCLFEAGGYIARAMSARQTPDWKLMPYIIQSLLTLLGPTLFAASIYMVLGRMISFLHGDSYSVIRPKWLTKFFLLGDILSFLGQGGVNRLTELAIAGGGILATAKSESSQSMGNGVILLGLGIQIVFFAFFMIVTMVFHVRIYRKPTTVSLSTAARWRRLLWVLYVTSLLIMVRSIFRLAEYAQGNDGALMQKEAYVYVLDALLMFIVTVIYSFYHPSAVLTENSTRAADMESHGAGDSYPMVKDNLFQRI
ncbi:RTA1 domain-containing protein [Colletotrichum truncatum]|uniref:RTA1 domain-containing protein n=1 Tax=Colletotrichum truncatum TaxID=5467 RepID=A0ACC3YQ24_COLTU|nr:RTA1 domain-containing protein [Colletotrichum truncatum]KAF6796747.1 RTA1 domain-containing protein [Colletotrichum truncatum]